MKRLSSLPCIHTHIHTVSLYSVAANTWVVMTSYLGHAHIIAHLELMS